MIRRWHVEPDIEVDTATGPVYACSVDALMQAVADAVVIANRAGGGLQMWFDRHPTGLPGEMVTTGAIVEWRDRTDAKQAPEKEIGTPQRPADDDLHFGTGIADKAHVASVEPPPEDDPTLYRAGEPVDDIGDGIDQNALPEEDDSEITEAVR